jgi:hypothetical protein
MKRWRFPIFVAIALLCIFWLSGRDKTRIPTDLDDAHRELARLFPPAEIERIRAMPQEDDMIEYHMGLGVYLRNEWGLWKGSRLSEYFDTLGVDHPDDISGIILNTFWCKLHDQPFRLQERAAYYQEYWRSVEKPKGGSPNDGARILWVIAQGVEAGTLHLGISVSDESYWRYVYGADRGIEPATEGDRKSLDELRETWNSSGVTFEEMAAIPD